MPKILGKPTEKHFPYSDLLLTEERSMKVRKIMRAANVWKLSDAIRFSVDYAYQELVEKANK